MAILTATEARKLAYQSRLEFVFAQIEEGAKEGLVHIGLDESDYKLFAEDIYRELKKHGYQVRLFSGGGESGNTATISF